MNESHITCRCQACDGEFEFPVGMAGQTFSCPRCRQSLTVLEAKRNQPNDVVSLARMILDTPACQHGRNREAVVNLLMHECGIDGANADKVWVAFNEIYGERLAEARQKAWKKAVDSMTPEEKEVLTKPMLDVAERLVNAGVLDVPSVLRANAKAQGWKTPDVKQKS